jgi:hypothetical protein
MDNKLFKFRLKNISNYAKKTRFYSLKETAQTVGCGNWFSSTVAQKRIKGIKA